MYGTRSPDPRTSKAIVPGIILCTKHAIEIVPEEIRMVHTGSQLFQELRIGGIEDDPT